jgi:hypothetical protein
MGWTEEAISHRKSIRHNMRLQNYCRHLKLQLAYHTCTVVFILYDEMSFPVGSLIVFT